MGQLTYRINPGDPEAAGLVACYTAVPGGMMELLQGTIGARSGTAETTRSTEHGTLEAAFDGTGDYYTFGSDTVCPSGSPWTIVWEAILDSFPAANDFPCIGTFKSGSASNPVRVALSNSAGFTDLTWGSASTFNTCNASLSGVASVTGERHWGVLTFDGVLASANSSYQAWVNGIALTVTNCSAFGTVTDQNTVSAVATDNEWNGGIRQVRVYNRAWGGHEARRFYDPQTRDALFRPPRRKLYAVAATSTGPSADAAITEAGDTLSSAATVSVQAAGAVTEAGDSLSSVGVVAVQATGAITEAGDTLSSAAAATVQATGTVTEAGDALSSVGVVAVQATGAITETGDSLSADGVVGTVPVQAAGAVTEAGDTASGAGTVPVQAAGAVTEAGDTASGAGAVTSTGTVTAVGAITEAGDTLAASASTGVFVVGNSAVFYARVRATTWTAQPKATTWTARKKPTTWIARRAA